MPKDEKEEGEKIVINPMPSAPPLLATDLRKLGLVEQNNR
jgi:hypothetical protein